MSRPRNKQELQHASNMSYIKLIAYISNLPWEEQRAEFPPGTLNRNIRDVLAHLHQWHLLFLKWYKVGMQGDKPDMPAKGFTWRTTSELNIEIQKKYCESSLKEVLQWLNNSFREVQNIISIHTNEELFEKQRYKWTGSTSLGAYLISATSSHYDWAYKLIKRCKKEFVSAS